MYCENCGTKLDNMARFCPSCGKDKYNQQDQISESTKDTQIKIQLRPEFNYVYEFIRNSGHALFYFFLFDTVVFRIHEYWPMFPISILITILTIALYIIGKMIIIKKQYNNIEYNFYDTKVEYKDGFINREEKELKYKHIKEITMSQNILERIFKIGTIKIHTNATSGITSKNSQNTMKGKNGIHIHCLKNVQEQYKIIKDIIDEAEIPDEY